MRSSASLLQQAPGSAARLPCLPSARPACQVPSRRARDSTGGALGTSGEEASTSAELSALQRPSARLSDCDRTDMVPSCSSSAPSTSSAAVPGRQSLFAVALASASASLLLADAAWASGGSFSGGALEVFKGFLVGRAALFQFLGRPSKALQQTLCRYAVLRPHLNGLSQPPSSSPRAIPAQLVQLHMVFGSPVPKRPAVVLRAQEQVEAMGPSGAVVFVLVRPATIPLRRAKTRPVHVCIVHSRAPVGKPASPTAVPCTRLKQRLLGTRARLLNLASS
jgi:hypothetical protein